MHVQSFSLFATFKFRPQPARTLEHHPVWLEDLLELSPNFDAQVH